MALFKEEGRVLSIQSHVVCGYVGNKSATFPLQVLGFEVDAINSVQFSNHTGYEHVKGQVLKSSELEELMEGLRLNDIHRYSHLLTGYVGDTSFLHAVVDVAKDLKKVNPRLIYVCDPVLGDNGQLYVPKELVPIYRDELIPFADIITPNQFETELLTGVKITDEESALAAISALHSLGPKTVVLSSTEFNNSVLIGYASSKNGDDDDVLVRIDIPRLPGSFTGTGDLFSACFLAWYTKTNGDLKLTMEKTVATLQAVLTRTQHVAKERAGENNHPTPAQRELQLIQSKALIENPTKTSTAVLLNGGI